MKTFFAIVLGVTFVALFFTQKSTPRVAAMTAKRPKLRLVSNQKE